MSKYIEVVLYCFFLFHCIFVGFSIGYTCSCKDDLSICLYVCLVGGVCLKIQVPTEGYAAKFFFIYLIHVRHSPWLFFNSQFFGRVMRANQFYFACLRNIYHMKIRTGIYGARIDLLSWICTTIKIWIETRGTILESIRFFHEILFFRSCTAYFKQNAKHIWSNRV